jgi:glycosyltransferase involved in cell wall biosynthesis
MRILFLTEEQISFSEPLVRGGAIHVRNVVEGLRERGHDVSLLDWNDAPERPFQSSVTPRTRFVDGPLRTAWRAVEVGRKNDVDVLVSKTRKTYLPGLVAARRLGVPHVVHVGSSLDRPDAGLFDRVNMASFVARLRAPHDGYFVVCDHIAAHLIDLGVPQSRIFNVRNAVDTERFHPEHIPTPLSRGSAERIDDDWIGVTVGYIGGLYGYKGVYDLLRAVRRCDVPIRVLVAGDGPERHKLEQAFGEDAYFLGSVPYEQIPSVYHEIDVFVLPSHTEGLPRVILEAQATATPVVGTKVGGVPEIVTDEETGLLCAPKNPTQLAKALERIATDGQLRCRLAETGREQVVHSFTWEELYGHYEAALESVTGPPSRTEVDER